MYPAIVRQISWRFIVAFAVSLPLFLVGCNGAKALAKRAFKFEEAGQFEAAANTYYTAVLKDRTNADATAGLQRTGQWVLDDKLQSFQVAVTTRNRAGAVSAYESADAYFEKIKSAGVALNFPESYRQQFSEVRDAHVSDLYNDGLQAMEQERFDAALSAFEEVLRLNPNYQDASQLADAAYCEPRYRKGSAALDSERFRTALSAFDEVMGRDKGYKEVAQLRSEALKNGMYTIAMIGFVNGSSRPNLENKFRSYVQQELAKSTDPFLKIVDRENQDLILQEQQMALSGVLDESSAVEVGGLLGAKALLKGTVVACEVATSELTRRRKQGFESYQVERVNSEGKKYFETLYRGVEYMEFEQSRDVEVQFNLVLISLKTGETLASEIITARENDLVRYIKYSGNARNLYPSSMSGNVVRGGRGEIQALLGARQALTQESFMVNDAVSDAATAIRKEVEQQMQTLVP